MLRPIVFACGIGFAALSIGCIGSPDDGIVGIAWIDENGDGIRQDDEPSIPGLPVRLYQLSSEVSNSGPEKFTVLRSQNTAADGTYRFFEYGTLLIEFEAMPGFAFTRKGAGANLDLNSDVDPETGRTDSQTYFDNSEVFNILDAGYVRMPGGSIRIRLFDDANANGIQDANEGQLIGPTVGVRFVDQTRHLAKTVLTQNGVAVASGLAPGKSLFQNLK